MSFTVWYSTDRNRLGQIDQHCDTRREAELAAIAGSQNEPFYYGITRTGRTDEVLARYRYGRRV